MTGTKFVVMTYNIGNGLAPASRLIEYLRSVQSDVIGLEEVSAEQASLLNLDLNDLYPHRIVQGSGYSGRALLSRYPIIEHGWIIGEPDRPDLIAKLNIGGRIVTIVVAHPHPQKPGRYGLVFDPSTLQHIHDTAHRSVLARPTVLLGDFNMTTRNQAYRWLTGLGLIDSYRLVGSEAGRTFPQRLCLNLRMNRRLTWVRLRPVVRLDYIWHTSELRSIDAWLGEDAGSDHLPVLARLHLVE